MDESSWRQQEWNRQLNENLQRQQQQAWQPWRQTSGGANDRGASRHEAQAARQRQTRTQPGRAEQERWDAAARSAASRIDEAYAQRRQADRVRNLLEQRREARRALDAGARFRRAAESAHAVSNRVRQALDQRSEEGRHRLNKVREALRTARSSTREQAGVRHVAAPVRHDKQERLLFREAVTAWSMPAQQDGRRSLPLTPFRREEPEET
jgi:hypothetical protein